MKTYVFIVSIIVLMLPLAGCGKKSSVGGSIQEKKIAEARMSVQKGNVVNAIQLLERAIKADPTKYEPYKELADLLFAAGELDRAETMYLQAARINESDTDIFNKLGLIYINKGDIQGAMRSLTVAIANDPGNVDAHFNLGNLALSRREIQVAANFYRKVLSLDPNHKAAQTQLSQIANALSSAQTANK